MRKEEQQPTHSPPFSLKPYGFTNQEYLGAFEIKGFIHVYRVREEKHGLGSNTEGAVPAQRQAKHPDALLTKVSSSSVSIISAPSAQVGALVSEHWRVDSCQLGILSALET